MQVAQFARRGGRISGVLLTLGVIGLLAGAGRAAFAQSLLLDELDGGSKVPAGWTAMINGTVTETPTSTPTDTPTVTPTDTPTVTPTDTPTVTPTDTPTLAPTMTPTVTPVPQGGECNDVSQCVPGLFCEDNVCCDRQCDRPLEQCNLPGREGSCTEMRAAVPAASRGGIWVLAVALGALGVFALLRRRRLTSYLASLL